MMLAIKITLIFLLAAYIKEMDLRYLLFNLKEETRLEKVLSSRDVSDSKFMELMGYTKVEFRQCHDSDYITTLHNERKIEDVVKECYGRQECTGIYLKNCGSKDENKVLCKGKPEEVTKENPNACFWIRKCRFDSDCPSVTPICQVGKCHECRFKSDCPSEHLVCDSGKCIKNQRYSLITDKGYCGHVSYMGHMPSKCFREGVSSQSLCEDHCTTWTSCIAFDYSTETAEVYSICSLIAPDSFCPSGFSHEPGPLAESKNDLIAFRVSGAVCYAKIENENITLSTK